MGEADFTAQFYAKMPVTDLSSIDPQTAIDLARSAFEFMKKRDDDAPKIRIFVPTKNTHGYDGKHTVVELLNDDMPFLVDSLSAELTRRGFTIHDTIHPIFRISRDTKGMLTTLGDKGDKRESLIHFEISSLPEDVSPDELQSDLGLVLRHIRASVEDWQPIITKAKQHAQALQNTPASINANHAGEVRDFLLWLTERNFVFLGYADYDYVRDGSDEKPVVVPESRLGILKINDEIMSHDPRLLPQLIDISKSNRRSLVHRSVPMDCITLKRFGASGDIIGETRILGLFTSIVYYQSTETIPLVRRKIASTLERSDFDPASHDGKSLKAILEFLPRDEIFQMSDEELFETSMGILALEAKPGVRLFVRKDSFERFISAMVFVPRERFSTELRRQIQDVVEAAYNGTTSSFATQITEAPLARLHLIVRTSPGDIPHVDLPKLEQEIAKRAYLWADLLQEALSSKYDGKKSEKYIRAYGQAFPQGYINRYDAGAAVYDIHKIEEAQTGGGLALELFRNKSEGEAFFHLKIYNPSEEIALSDILPLLENAGFRVIDEHPFLIAPKGSTPVWIRDFKLEHNSDIPVVLEQVKPLFEEALLNVWRGEMENDRFNALILKAGLNARQVVMLRAYAKYARQAGFSHTQPTIEQAFSAYPLIAKNIAALFEARFDVPEKDHTGKQTYITSAIEQQLSQVQSAAQDKIFRRYMELIAATLRTNYFQTNKPVLSFKFQSNAVPELPKPVPFAEIFVYSPRVEGIHLRGGKVARGGLRWSDRHEDFRTEVLGLMKAQMVKNSVIVPVGSKGGFVVKRPPAARDAMMEEGVACYKLYLSGLLDITDNIVAGKITPPSQTVRHDGDDPYLVVAADKGTASFSDIANGVSAAYGFWLGDAFASGGSVGYDHKKMAITARGGFVSVRRHFAEMGVDIDSTPFTTVGIGDMAGDVFGNGMLLSNNIRLLAAFNHMHIFIDPTPDEKTSFKERERLFNLPRSSWKDYDAKLISAGGGIYERSAKSITVSKEAASALGLAKTTFAPDELIRAILLAPVDLLWNGGIGTYVKAEDETNDQVGDRANNALRVNGRELRCKIVGEGGNLGFTQKGRIEYAKLGGRINTDAIDNSAGVDCSDHEVNIKIAFSSELSAGKLTLDKRDALLAGMTDEVAALVLKDNILQTQAITIAQAQGASALESHVRLIHQLEKQNFLDRAIEFLPTYKQLEGIALAGKGLTRPELAVLLAYSKMALYKDIVESDLADDAYFAGDLKRYFPKAMQGDFAGAIASHPLKREIICTVITNSLVNRAGLSFAFDLSRDLGASLRDVAAAYSVVRDMFGLRALWHEIEAAPLAAQADMFAAIQRFLERTVAWLLRSQPLPLDMSVVARDFAPVAMPAAATTVDKIAQLELQASAFDIIAVARAGKRKPEEVAPLYFAIGERLQLAALRERTARIQSKSHWERMALQTLVGDLYDEQRRLATAGLAQANVEAWATAHNDALAAFDQSIAPIIKDDVTDVPRLLAALKAVKQIQ